MNRRRFLLSALAAPVAGVAAIEPLSTAERALRDAQMFSSNPAFLIGNGGTASTRVIWYSYAGDSWCYTPWPLPSDPCQPTRS